MDEDKTLNAVRNLMRELNEVVALKATEQELIHRHAQLQHEVEQKIKEKKLEHLNDVHKRKQQPKQIKHKKKQKVIQLPPPFQVTLPKR